MRIWRDIIQIWFLRVLLILVFKDALLLIRVWMGFLFVNTSNNSCVLQVYRYSTSLGLDMGYNNNLKGFTIAILFTSIHCYKCYQEMDYFKEDVPLTFSDLTLVSYTKLSLWNWVVSFACIDCCRFARVSLSVSCVWRYGKIIFFVWYLCAALLHGWMSLVLCSLHCWCIFQT